MKKNEARLRSQDIQTMSGPDLIKFTFSRKSFYRDYELLHGQDESEVKERLKYVTCFENPQNLAKEIRLCFNAAIQMESRQTYYFNLFVIDLVERYYSDAIYYSKKEEIKDKDLVEPSSSSISFEWVLSSGILNTYQRYLLFEYLTLGYSIEDLARRRHCTSRTIQNHLGIIAEVLDSLEQEALR